jgi:hypothetical protein
MPHLSFEPKIRCAISQFFAWKPRGLPSLRLFVPPSVAGYLIDISYARFACPSPVNMYVYACQCFPAVVFILDVGHHGSALELSSIEHSSVPAKHRDIDMHVKTPLPSLFAEDFVPITVGSFFFVYGHGN